MSVEKTFKKQDSMDFLDSILLSPQVLEVYSSNKSFLEGKESKDVVYVINSLKMIFESIKNFAFERFVDLKFDLPSVYFLITPFYQDETNKNEVYSMTLSLRAKMANKENIKLKRVLVFAESFYLDFKQAVKDFFSMIVEHLVSEYNVDILNKTILAGGHLYYDLDVDLSEVDIESIDGVFDDYDTAVEEYKENNLIVPSFKIGNVPILDISKDEIVFGVTINTMVNELEDKDLVIISDFLYSLSKCRKELTDTKNKKEELEKELTRIQTTSSKTSKDTAEDSISDAFFGLEGLFGSSLEDENEEEKVKKEIQKCSSKIGSLEYNIYMSFIGIKSRVENIFSKLISSENTIQFLAYYPSDLMELVVTQPTCIRTQRIAPLMKDSFYEDEDYFNENVDTGILFTYTKGHKVRTPLGLKLEPENAFHGRIIKKIDSVEYSVGLDDFFMSKLAKIAKVVRD